MIYSDALLIVCIMTIPYDNPVSGLKKKNKTNHFKAQFNDHLFLRLPTTIIQGFPS